VASGHMGSHHTVTVLHVPAT